MAKTTEGKIKDKVKKVLADSERFGYIYSNWPVPAGYGIPTLDCIGSVRGRFFGIETKAPGKKPTPRQELCIQEMSASGSTVFVIDTLDTTLLEEWLSAVCSGEPQTQGSVVRT